MLVELHIQNFAVIEELSLDLGAGLTTVTGETGAGKSIIVTAINLLLGDRAASDLIRTGCDEAVVEALFAADDSDEMGRLFEELDLGDFNGELLVRRVISRTGRNKVMVNGRLSTLQMLTRLAEPLLSVAGQHEHQSLLRPDVQLALVDDFGGLWPAREEVGRLVRRWRDLQGRLDGWRRNREERLRRLDLLRFERQELEAAGLAVGQIDDLTAEQVRLAGAERLHAAFRQAHQQLYDDAGSVVEVLRAVETELAEVADLEPESAVALEAVRQAYFLVDEAGVRCRDLAEGVVFDPARLEAVGERLSQLKRLTAKYGGNEQAALDHLARISRELDDLEKDFEDASGLEDECRRAWQETLDAAQKLSDDRRQAAETLGRAVERTLEDLAMAGTEFQVAFEPVGPPDESGREAMTETGLERARFLISPNVGEPPRPLARIASGGELSRVMLALRALDVRRVGQETIVFDEVDAGIGGGAAEAVGRLLGSLAESHQLVCITHLPQIAVFGREHWRVIKEVVGGRTATRLDRLDDEDRTREVARMISGPEFTEAGLAHAREMLHKQAPTG
jgi:DNA repair protein RecN (Recombination protein N)